MTCFSWWKQLFTVSVILSVNLLLEAPGFTQEPDYICYFQRSDGVTVDLSEMCGGVTTVLVLSLDDRFISDFENEAEAYPDATRRALIAYANESRTALIASARVACRVLRGEGPRAEARLRQNLAANDAASFDAARRNMVLTLARRYYCP